MNPAKVPAGISSPASIETANAQATIFIIDPERWIVAQSGTTVTGDGAVAVIVDAIDRRSKK